jgi:hypothetical protein
MDKTWAARMLVAVRTRDHGMAAFTRLDPFAACLRATRGHYRMFKTLAEGIPQHVEYCNG